MCGVLRVPGEPLQPRQDFALSEPGIAAPLPGQDVHRDRPALALLAHTLHFRQQRAVEEDLREFVVPVGLADRAHSDARGVEPDYESAEAAVALFGASRTGQEETVGGPLRPAGPDLVAFDPVAVLDAFGAGTQSGEIGARGGFGEALAPEQIAAQRGQEEFFEEFGPRELLQRRWQDVQMLEEMAGRVAVALQEVRDDASVHDAATQPAVFLRPAVARPAGVEEIALQGLKIAGLVVEMRRLCFE